MIPILTLKAFKEWLQGKDPTDIVGSIQSPLCCPVASYLNEKTGAQYEVGCKTYHQRFGQIVDYHSDNRLPVWAQDFIMNIDKMPGLECRYVNAKQALSLFK